MGIGKFNRTIVAAGIIGSVITGMALSANAASPFVADELLVQHKAGVAAGKMDEIFRGHGAATIKEFSQIRVRRIKVPAGAMEKVRAALRNNPHVSFVEPNYIAQAVNTTPNDVQYPYQWHLSAIWAPQGWDLSTGSTAVPIAVVDTGVDPTHPDLAGKLLPGWNFVAGNSDTHDVHGHGTAVAGTAAAIGNNVTGVAGVAWANPVMPLMISDATGSATYSNIASAIVYAADHGARVINISFGGSSNSVTLQNAINYAWSKGAVIFASAGNSGTSTPLYPAACDHVIAVSATTSSDTLASWSSYGNWVDISAPGASILTTARGGGYAYVSGTSFSSPVSAGLAALALSVNPALTNTDLETVVKNNADDLGTAGFDPQFGYGRINTYYTLLAAKAAVPQPDTVVPVASITSPALGATVSGVSSVDVSATDDIGVTKVELYVDGVLYATDTVGPFSFAWDTAKYGNGAHDLMAIAYDAAGNAGQSNPVTVTVNNFVDTTAPAVTITSPANGTTVSGTVSIRIAATDNVKVTRIQLYIDGVLKSTSTSATLSYSWGTRRVATGAHTIAARAFDAAGNMATASITVFR